MKKILLTLAAVAMATSVSFAANLGVINFNNYGINQVGGGTYSPGIWDVGITPINADPVNGNPGGAGRHAGGITAGLFTIGSTTPLYTTALYDSTAGANFEWTFVSAADVNIPGTTPGQTGVQLQV
jgi:hypothetical protein